MIETTVNTETLTGISLPPKTVVGYRANGMPIYNIAGGSVEVDDNVEDDDDDDTAEDDSEDAEDEWVPPSKEEFERLLQAKQKADSEAAARKRFLREAGLDPKTGKPSAKKPAVRLEDLDDEDDSVDDEVEAQRKDARGDGKARSDKAFQRQLEREIAKTESRVRAEARDETTALLAAVPTSLNDAGWNGKSLDRIIKLLDFDDIHIDSDGEIDGLDDQITALKEDFPHFFKRARMKEAAKEVADTKTVGGGRKTAPAAETNLNWTERLKAELYKH